MWGFSLLRGKLNYGFSSGVLMKYGIFLDFFSMLFLIKVAQWKNGFIKRPHKTTNLNFPCPKLIVRLLFSFVIETSQFLTAKTLAQLLKN